MRHLSKCHDPPCRSTGGCLLPAAETIVSPAPNSPLCAGSASRRSPGRALIQGNRPDGVPGNVYRVVAAASGVCRDSLRAVWGEPYCGAVTQMRHHHQAEPERGGPLPTAVSHRHPGAAGHCTQLVPVLDKIRVTRLGRGRPRRKPASLAADKAYSNGPRRDYLRRRGIRHTISEKADSQAARRRQGSRGGRPPGFDKERFKKRNTVEAGHQEAETVPGRGHSLRQARVRLPRHSHCRSRRHLAPVMSRFSGLEIGTHRPGRFQRGRAQRPRP